MSANRLQSTHHLLSGEGVVFWCSRRLGRLLLQCCFFLLCIRFNVTLQIFLDGFWFFPREKRVKMKLGMHIYIMLDCIRTFCSPSSSRALKAPGFQSQCMSLIFILYYLMRWIDVLEDLAVFLVLDRFIDPPPGPHFFGSPTPSRRDFHSNDRYEDLKHVGYFYSGRNLAVFDFS